MQLAVTQTQIRLVRLPQPPDMAAALVPPAQPGPALPWAQNQPPGPAPTAEADGVPTAGLQLKDLGLGDAPVRIAVRWTVHRNKENVKPESANPPPGTHEATEPPQKEVVDEQEAEQEEEEEERVWWGATVTQLDDATIALADVNTHGFAYLITYDGRLPDFPESQSTIRLVSEHLALDASAPKEPLFWRAEGDTWEPASDEDDDGEGSSCEEGDAGGSGDAMGLDMFGQQVVAGAILDINAKLEELAERKRAAGHTTDGQVVLETEDVLAVFDELRAQRGLPPDPKRARKMA